MTRKPKPLRGLTKPQMAAFEEIATGINRHNHWRKTISILIERGLVESHDELLEPFFYVTSYRLTEAGRAAWKERRCPLVKVEMERTMKEKCKTCGGDGFTIDECHHANCNEFGCDPGCPDHEQNVCRACGGKGYVEVKDEEG